MRRGHVVLLAFMDPLCVNLCPILGRDIVAVEQALPKTVKPVLLIVSVMPDRTAANVATFIKTNLTTQWDRRAGTGCSDPDATLEIDLAEMGRASRNRPRPTTSTSLTRRVIVRVVYPAPLFVSDVVHAVTTVANE